VSAWVVDDDASQTPTEKRLPPKRRGVVALSCEEGTPRKRRAAQQQLVAPVPQAKIDLCKPLQQTLFQLGFGAWRVPRGDASPVGGKAELPKGAIDIYGGPGSALFRYRPRSLPMHRLGVGLPVPSPATTPLTVLELELYAMRMHEAEVRVRREAEALLHGCWGDGGAARAVSRLLELDTPASGMTLRSGRHTGRGSSTAPGETWLIWEQRPRRASDGDVDGDSDADSSCSPVVGALVLRSKRPLHDDGKLEFAPQGTVFIEYVAARRSHGGRGWPMVLAAEGICRREGFGSLYSAADLVQDGRFADVEGTSAEAAHLRWGFQRISEEEWTSVGLDLYDHVCRVAYMRKPPS